MFRLIPLVASVAGAYLLLRGWSGAPSLVLRACFAVAGLVAGLALWGVRCKGNPLRLVCLRRAGWADYLSLGAAVVFAEACFVVLTSMLAAPSQRLAEDASHVWQGFVEDGGAVQGGDEVVVEEGRGFGSGEMLFEPNLERNLPKRSNHKPSNKPELFVQLETAEDATRLLNSRIHLRSFALTRFDGVTWSAVPFEQRELPTPVRFDSEVDQSMPGVGGAIRYRVFHGTNPTGQNVFSALHGVVSSDVSRLFRVSDSIFLLPDLVDEENGYQYSAVSRPIHFTDLIDFPLAPGAGEPEAVRLHQSLSLALEQTAGQFKGEEGLARQLVALRSFLQDNYKYSLETSNEENRNPLENFLYQEKRGYCEHFATAAAMLCRSLGVPSRIAYGWSGGRLYPSQNMFVFRAKDAHAWTEIKLEGYGWVVFDTTPPDDEATPEAHAVSDTVEAPDPKEVLADQYHRRQEHGAGVAGLSQRFVIRPGPLWVALAVVGVGALALLVFRYLKRPELDGDGRPVKVLTPTYLVYFKQTCAALGYPMPVGRTLRQQVELIRRQEDPPEFVDALLEYHYGLIYGECRKDKGVERNLERAISRWKKESLRES